MNVFKIIHFIWAIGYLGANHVEEKASYYKIVSMWIQRNTPTLKLCQ